MSIEISKRDAVAMITMPKMTTTTTATTKMLEKSMQPARERLVGISERNHWRWNAEELELWSSLSCYFVFDFAV